MPNYEDPLDAAVSRPTVGGLGGAYNQTTPSDLRNVWLAESGRKDAVGRAARFQLQNLDRKQAFAQRDSVLSQRNDALQQRLAFRDAALQQNDIHFNANQTRLEAHDAATQAYHQLSTDRDTEIDQQGHGLMNSMLQLDGALRRGEISKDQYDQGLLDAGQQFPLGTRHPEAARHYEFAITEADKQNAFNARRELTQVAKIGAKYGIDPQFDPETGQPSLALTQQAALQTPKGKNEALTQMNHEMSAKYGVPTGVGSLFNPIAPHVGTDAQGNQVDNPTHVALPFLDAKTNTVGKLPVPNQLFDQMKADFNDKYFALNPPSTGQPAGAAPTAPNAAPAAQIPTIGSADEYQSLPAGSTFISNGRQFQKPAEQAQPQVAEQPTTQ